MQAIATNENITNRGYFEKDNNDSLWKIYIEYNDSSLCLAKRTNLTYTEYNLSIKDIEFILSSLEQLWNNSLYFEILNKRSKGKIITMIKNQDRVSIKINDVTMFSNFNRFDCKKLYAMLKELTIYGKTNKLE